MRAPFVLGLLALALPAPALAESPRLEAFEPGVRFDLETLRFLPAGRPDGPQDPAPYRLPSPVRRRAVRDEVVAFTVLARGAPGPHRIESAPLRHETTTATLTFDVFQARAIRITDPTESDFVHPLGAGLYPGPLVPTDTATVPEVGAAMLWVDVFVPPEAAPGTYAGALRIGGAELGVRVDVAPLTLPARDVARLGAVNFGSLLFRGNEDPTVERRWMQMAHAHHLSVEVMRPTPKVHDDGRIDWDGWAARVGPYVSGEAFTAPAGYRGPRAGRPTTRWIVPLTDWWPSKPTDAHLPSDPEGWSRTLRAWERFVASRGWFDLPEATTWILFVNSLDEPHDPETIESLAAYGPLIEAAQLEDPAHALFRVDGNFGQKIEGYDDAKMAEVLGPVTDLWNVHGAPWTIPWPRLVKRRREAGERVMAYFSNTSGEPALPPTTIDAPLAGLRAWGWIVARYDLEGLLNWEVDYFDEACRGNPRCSPGGKMNLEANLIFRGELYGRPEGEPLASIRLKALRQGAQDVALWSMFAERAPDTAGLIAAAVVPQALGDQVPPVGAGAWSLDPLTYARARTAVLDRLLQRPDPFPLEKIRPDPLPRWAWHPERWLIGFLTALVGFLALVYIVKK